MKQLLSQRKEEVKAMVMCKVTLPDLGRYKVARCYIGDYLCYPADIAPFLTI